MFSVFRFCGGETATRIEKGLTRKDADRIRDRLNRMAERTAPICLVPPYRPAAWYEVIDESMM